MFELLSTPNKFPVQIHIVYHSSPPYRDCLQINNLLHKPLSVTSIIITLGYYISSRSVTFGYYLTSQCYIIRRPIDYLPLAFLTELSFSRLAVIAAKILQWNITYTNQFMKRKARHSLLPAELTMTITHNPQHSGYKNHHLE